MRNTSKAPTNDPSVPASTPQIVTEPDQLYRTEIEIKRSRFIATLTRTDTAEQAREFINLVKAEFPDARHTCSAFIVSPADAVPITRSSDDGEPSGTAGRPMLETLTGSGLTNVACTVTRYFGGILLGTGGLVRAYTEATQAVLALAPRLQVLQYPTYCVGLPLNHAPRVLAALHSQGYIILQEQWLEQLVLRLTHPEQNATQIASFIASQLGQPVTLNPLPPHILETPI